jgi:hypothetical protein
MSAEEKFLRIADDITELKVTLAKQEVNAENSNKILDRLTESVETHVRRSAALENLVELVRSETAAKIESEILPIKAHVHFVKGAIYTLGILGALLMALQQLGILQKIFGA